MSIPFELAELAAEVAELAALVAAEGNPNVSGDAAAGGDLAAAAASIGARLVAINAGRATSASSKRARWPSARRAQLSKRPRGTCPRDCPWDTSYPDEPVSSCGAPTGFDSGEPRWRR